MRYPIGTEFNPETGFGTDYFFDPAEGKVIVQRWQEVDALLDDNQKQYNASSDYRPFSGSEMHKMASVPMATYEKWRQEGFDILSDDCDDKELRRRLNNSDYKKFRTKPGKL